VECALGKRAVCGLILLAATIVSGCGGDGDPFSYVPVSGKITYDDGTVIPAPEIILTFVPETPPPDKKTYPKAGMVPVDVATGKYGVPSTHKGNDGIVRGKHKVVVSLLSRQPISPKFVPKEYADDKTTPLELDTASPATFELKVHKPK
jgi:hypothetical protein